MIKDVSPTSTMPRRLLVYIDGAMSPQRRYSALAVVVRGEDRKTYQVWSQRIPACSMLEAEYRAALLALHQLQPFNPRQVSLFSDCAILVAQLTGQSAIREPALQVLNLRFRVARQPFQSVTVRHIPTEWNQLACAVSWRVLEGELN